MSENNNPLIRFHEFLSPAENINEIKKRCIEKGNVFFLIEGESGCGMSHLLRAIRKELKQNRNASNIPVISAYHIVHSAKKLKDKLMWQAFCYRLSQHDGLIIDDLQACYRNKRTSEFIFNLIQLFECSGKLLVLGCNDPNRNIFNLKKAATIRKPAKITITPLPGSYAFEILKRLCTAEDQIPEALLYEISGHQAPIQRQIACLISIRFRSRAQTIDLFSYTAAQLNEIFGIQKFLAKRKQPKQLKINFELLEKIAVERKELIKLSDIE